MPRKPDNLVYGVEETPGALTLVLLGFQHICIMCIAFIIPVVIIEMVNGTVEQKEHLVAMAMFATGVGTMLQALKRGPVGSGYLCPLVNGPAFLNASRLAAQAGGLPLIFGMTAFAGVCEALFSRFVARLRAVFPSEVTGTIVLMVGIEMVPASVKLFCGVDSAHHDPSARCFAVGGFTLLAMAGLNVWGRGPLRLYSVLIGMLAGYGVAAAAGVLTPEALAVWGAQPWWRVPDFGQYGMSFDSALLVPFFVAMLSSALKTMGDLTTCQRLNDADWKRPEMNSIGRGILACGISNLLSGFVGALGQSPSSSNVGLSIATGAASRAIAWSVGAILIAMAFFPKFGGFFVIMPSPVMGAALVFAVGFMVVAGLQIITSRLIDSRKTFVIGISIIFGLSVEFLPALFNAAPAWLAPFVCSSLSVTTLTAVLLNLVFRLGVAKTATLTLPAGRPGEEAIFAFMDRQGAAWGALRDVTHRARAAVTELHEMLVEHELAEGEVTVTATFDEFNLDIDAAWEGRACRLPTVRPTMEHILLDEEEQIDLSGFIVHHLADNVTLREDGRRHHARLHFIH